MQTPLKARYGVYMGPIELADRIRDRLSQDKDIDEETRLFSAFSPEDMKECWHAVHAVPYKREDGSLIEDELRLRRRAHSCLAMPMLAAVGAR